MPRKLNVIDLFSGCGGLTDGFEKTGLFNTRACVEWDEPSCNNLKNRLEKKWNYSNAEKIIFRFDIQRTNELLKGWKNDDEFNSSEGMDKLISKKMIDIIIGGPPCQAYSVAGRIRDKNGMKNDYRNFLFESYIRLIKYYKPKAFIFENVPGILSAKPGGKSIISRIQKGFSSIGYVTTSNIKENALIDCSDYGIPQKRKRIIILGLDKNFYRHKTKKMINNYYNNLLPSFKSKQTMNVSQAIFDLPKFFPDKKNIRSNNRKFSHSPINSSFANHTPRYHNKRDISIFRELAKDIEEENNKYTSVVNLKKLYFQKTGKKSNIHKYYVLRKNQPSNTIPAHLHKDGLRHIHPDSNQARSITVREAARLQSFDDDYIFSGSMSDQYKMIGNAVPPKFAKILGISLYNLLK